jgi:hypothetical protein
MTAVKSGLGIEIEMIPDAGANLPGQSPSLKRKGEAKRAKRAKFLLFLLFLFLPYLSPGSLTLEMCYYIRISGKKVGHE